MRFSQNKDGLNIVNDLFSLAPISEDNVHSRARIAAVFIQVFIDRSTPLSYSRDPCYGLHMRKNQSKHHSAAVYAADLAITRSIALLPLFRQIPSRDLAAAQRAIIKIDIPRSRTDSYPQNAPAGILEQQMENT